MKLKIKKTNLKQKNKHGWRLQAPDAQSGGMGG
jgi:hypothetical protein